jgi:hypothetical protein
MHCARPGKSLRVKITQCLDTAKNSEPSLYRLQEIVHGLASSKITSVQITKNNICATSIGALCIPVYGNGILTQKITTKQQHTVKNLLLDCNPITAEGATILARAINAQTSLLCCLSTLRVGYTKLTAAGQLHVAVSLNLLSTCDSKPVFLLFTSSTPLILSIIHF